MWKPPPAAFGVSSLKVRESLQHITDVHFNVEIYYADVHFNVSTDVNFNEGATYYGC